MKNRTKLLNWTPSALACLALSASVAVGKPVITVDTYDNAFTAGIWDWYGGSTLTWDGSQDHTGTSGSGSLHIAKNTANDHIFDVESFAGNNWDNGKAYDLTLYTNLSLWIKWDTANSTMGISEFNSSMGGLTMELNDNHLGQYDWSGNGLHALPAVQIPNAASNGWVHLNVPVSSTIPYIDTIGSIIFDAYHSAPWSGTVAFWVDDITFQPAAVDVIPPPIIAPITKATPGLNVFASTAGLYDRQSVVLRQTSGLSWIGQATPANPVTYSFTIAGYPNSVNCEAWLFLIPNPNYLDAAPDWNETNGAIVYLQGSTTSATAHFQYKVNENNQMAMFGGGSETRTDGSSYTNNYYYSQAPGSMPGGPVTNVLSPGVYNITNESGNLASITNNSILGTWTLKFTSDSSVTLITPNGNSTNFTIPAYNTGYFAEQTSPAFRVYLGMQANNADALNQAVVYSNFAISHTGSPFSEDFLTDPVLDTTNVWDTSAGPGPLGVFVAPTGSVHWVTWSLPDTAFNLQVAPTLTDPLAWTTPTTGPKLAMNGIRSQLVATSEIPAGNTAFFQLIKRQFTQLQVLLPGETNAPNTLTGKGGTPTVFNAGDTVNVTINAVDSTFHIVNSSDVVDLTSTDGGPIFYFSNYHPSLVGGTVTVPGNFDSGSWTVTATDATDASKTAATSSAITIQ